MNFTHAYNSSYSIGSFITNLNYSEEGDGFSYVRDIGDNFIAPYDINSVSIIETFSPLIDVDIIWVNDYTSRAAIQRTRNMTLSFANNQLTEVLRNEFTVGMGYRFTHMDLIIKPRIHNVPIQMILIYELTFLIEKIKQFYANWLKEMIRLRVGKVLSLLKQPQNIN